MWLSSGPKQKQNEKKKNSASHSSASGKRVTWEFFTK